MLQTTDQTASVQAMGLAMGVTVFSTYSFYSSTSCVSLDVVPALTLPARRRMRTTMWMSNNNQVALSMNQTSEY